MSGDLATIKTMIGNDPEGLAVSLSGPVALDRKPVYPIRNYGSAMRRSTRFCRSGSARSYWRP